MLFSVSNRFVFYFIFYFISLHWGKTDWILFTSVIAFRKRDCPLVWKLVECTFNHQACLYKDVRCERSKQTKCKSRLYDCMQTIVCKRQVDYMLRNLLLIKVQVLNRIYTKNCITRTEILLVSFVMYFFFFHITPELLLLKIGV